MENKKLLFITTRIFWPATSGRKVSLYYYCKGLHEQYGYDIYLYSFLEADQAPTQSEQTKPDFIKEIQFAREVRKSEIVANLITKSFSHLQWPLQCSLFYSKKNEENIRDYVSKEHFDVVIADMIRTAPYIRAFEGEPCLKILDMDDLLSKRYQRTLNSTVSGDNFLGQYSKHMPNIVNKQLIPRVKKIALNMEVSRLLRAEVEYAQRYDHVIFVSDVETDELNQKLREAKCTTITLGVDYDYYSQQVPYMAMENQVAFIGNFGYTPNVDSLKVITANILPKLDDKIRLLAVGKAPQEVEDEFRGKRVDFTGTVEDLRPYIRQCSVFLAPIAYGSGIKTKILEAMAMGVPVVTNSIGAEGISAANGVDFFVTDDFDEMAQIVTELNRDKQKAHVVGRAGAAYVQKHHQWKSILEKFKDIGV